LNRERGTREPQASSVAIILRAHAAEFCRGKPALSPQKQRLSVDAPTTKDYVAKNVFCQKTTEEAICGFRPSNFHDRRSFQNSASLTRRASSRTSTTYKLRAARGDRKKPLLEPRRPIRAGEPKNPKRHSRFA
jgi:hypothetical protein